MEKLVVIFSDSHNSSFNMSEVMKRYPNAECVIHLGDGCGDTSYLSLGPATGLLCVKGNCDLMSREPVYNRVDLCGVDIIMCHGDAYGVKYGVGRYEAHALRERCDVALFGHTHVPYKNVIETPEKNIVVFNPGSVSRPFGSGPTYGLLRIDGDKFDISVLPV